MPEIDPNLYGFPPRPATHSKRLRQVADFLDWLDYVSENDSDRTVQADVRATADLLASWGQLDHA